MERTSSQRSSGAAGAAFVTVLGGAAAIAAAFLTWSSLGAGRIGSGLNLRGTKLPAGRVALIGGIMLVLLGVGLWLVQAPEVRRWLTVAAVVVGGMVVGAAISELQSEVTVLARELLGGNRPPGGAGSRLGRGLGQGLTGPTRGPGIYLALTAGLVALAGGVAGVFWTTVPASRPVQSGQGGSTGGAFSKGRAG